MLWHNVIQARISFIQWVQNMIEYNELAKQDKQKARQGCVSESGSVRQDNGGGMICEHTCCAHLLHGMWEWEQ